MALTFPSGPSTGQVFNPGPGLPSWMWDGGKWTSGTTPPLTLAQLVDVGLSSPTGGQALTYDGTRWINGGNARFTAGTLGGPVIRSTTSTATNWAAYLDSSVAGGYGLYIQAGDTSSDYTALFRNRAGTTAYFNLAGDGSGFIGPNATNVLSWTVQGDYTIATPIGGGAALTIKGNTIFENPEAGGAFTGQWINDGTTTLGLTVYGSAYSGGSAFGVGASGVSLSTSSTAPFAIGTFGAGELMLGTNGVPRLQLGPAGNVTVNSPSPGWTPLSVFGHGGGDSLFVCQILGGANNPGFYVNMTDSPSEVTLSFSGYNIPSFARMAFAGNTVFGMFPNGQCGVANYFNATGPTMAFGASVNGVYPLGIAGSSRRFKDDISTLRRDRARRVLEKLRPVRYHPKGRTDDIHQYGFIAEEVAEVDPDLVHFDEEGKPLSVMTDRVTALLLPLVRELLGMEEPEEAHG